MSFIIQMFSSVITGFVGQYRIKWIDVPLRYLYCMMWYWSPALWLDRTQETDKLRLGTMSIVRVNQQRKFSSFLFFPEKLWAITIFIFTSFLWVATLFFKVMQHVVEVSKKSSQNGQKCFLDFRHTFLFLHKHVKQSLFSYGLSSYEWASTHFFS